jgi:hypothetical protein
MKKGVLLFLLFMVTAASVALAKNKKDVVYIFGASISLADSTVYLTEIQALEGVKLEKGDLPHRQYYAYELKDYMSRDENMPGRASVIYFSKNRSKLEKKEIKLRERLIEKERKNVLYIGSKFKFTKP